MEEEELSEIWWRPFACVNKKDQIRVLAPKCIVGCGPFEKVTIYPTSGLISLDDKQLFACHRALYPLWVIADVGVKVEKQLWHEVLLNATNVGLNNGEEENVLMIFFTMFGDSFESNQDQPFGLWAQLEPIPYQSRIIRPLHAIIARRKRKKEKLLAFAAAGHHRLGNQIEVEPLKAVAENADLMRMIILAVLGH